MFFTKIAGVLAILATLCLGGLVTLQVLEYQHYQSPPSVWPVKAP